MKKKSDRVAQFCDLKPGDRVFVGSSLNSRGQLVTVDLLTGTQIVMTNGYRYWQQTGKSVGGITRYISHATPEEIRAYDDKVERDRKASDARDAKLKAIEVRRQGLHDYLDRLGLVDFEIEHDFSGGVWSVSFRGLSPDRVRQIAEAVSQCQK